MGTIASRGDDGEGFILAKGFWTLKLASIGMMTGFATGAFKSGTYKTFKLNRMRYSGGKSDRINMLKYLKKRSKHRE